MITAEQRLMRKQFVCSSDAPAVCGVDPYRNAADIYYDKVGLADDFAGNANTDRGNILEPVLIDWAERQLGFPLGRNVFVEDYDGRPLACNLDACNADRRAGVEAKTATNPDEWGDAGTDQVPERVLVQTAQAMDVTGFDVFYVPLLMPRYHRFEFRMYEVRRGDLCGLVAERCVDFWNRHVLARVEPTHCLPSIEVLKRIRRVPDQTREIPDELLVNYIECRLREKAAKEKADESQRALIAAMGTAEGGTIGGELRVSYLQTARKGYTVEPTTYRRLQVVLGPAVVPPAKTTGPKQKQQTQPAEPATESPRRKRARARHTKQGSAN